MLKAAALTAFTIPLPEILPQLFTIEADFVSSTGGSAVQFAVRGTTTAEIATLTGTTRSAPPFGL